MQESIRMHLHELSEKEFSTLTDAEKYLSNAYFILTSHEEALQILEKNRSAYMPQITIINEITNLKNHINNAYTDYLKSKGE